MSFLGFEDRSFYKALLKLALPMMLQQAVASSITLVDNVMVGALGDYALAALLQANQVSFLMLVFMFGVSSATQAFTAQFWGKADMESIRRTQGLALICGQVIGWSFFLAALCFPRGILCLFTSDEAVLTLGVDYLQVVCFTYPMVGMTYVYAAVLRGTGNVKLPMCTSIVGLIGNGVLNYLLIFGHLGLPALGVRGAAIATAIAQAVDMGLLYTLSHVLKKPTADGRYPLFAFSGPFARRFFKVAVPVFLNESLWSLAQSTTILFYSWLGTQMAAAMGIFNVFDKLGYVAFIGLGNACGVMCGNQIGAGNEARAQLYARRIWRVAPIMGVLAGIAVNLALPLLLQFYGASEAVKEIVRNNVMLYGLFCPVMVINYVVVVGILRSGGDMRFSIFLDAGMQWLCMVGGVALGAFVCRVPLKWVYAFILPGELVKLVLGHRRLISRAWIHNLTHMGEPSVSASE